MNPTEEQVSDVEIVLKGEWAGRNQEAVDLLTRAGLFEVSLDDDDGMIEGTIPSRLLAEMEKVACVAYVRVVFSYVDHEDGKAPDAGV